jgi:two-component system sensor histidine kinase/response regulator
MPPMREQPPPPRSIMVVDDNPANLKLLEDMLTQHRYEVRSFPRGRLALRAAEQEPPDLILLDINMPEMNGYEMSEQLKSSPSLSGVPVIFLSALNATEDKVKGFQSGGVDFISKPFQFEEVHARVETHLKLRGLQQALTLQNERLEETVASRTRELAEANQRLMILDRSKNEFLGLISHELRTPLNGLLGVGELILDGMPSTDQNKELQVLFEGSRRRILSILDDALLLTHIDVDGEQFRSGPVLLHEALGRAIENTTEFARSRQVAIAPPPAEPDLVLADADLLVRALHALLVTAVKFSLEGGTIRLIRGVAPGSPTVTIDSQGKTIPRPALAKLFEVFSVSEASTPGGDLGLGPAVAYRILSLFGGSVSAANRDPSGIRLMIWLRRAARDGSV